MRRQSRFKQAMTAYNRTAGQLKRYYKVDPAKYIEGKTTTAGVERALKELRREAERQQVEKAVKEYEVKRFMQKRAKIIESQKPKFYFDEENRLPMSKSSLSIISQKVLLYRGIRSMV